MKPGDVVASRFEILGRAGAGGMGTVYRARDRSGGGELALKVLHASGDVGRFARESEVLAELRHPGIVRYIAHGEDGDILYLAMEWIEGLSLAQRLASGELTVAESVALAGQLARALGAAHARGVLHRDVKPGNIVLRRGDAANAILVDFGVARRLTGGDKLTATGIAIGTPSYMAPEQARGSASIDGRADLFALGCVLYRCLAGQPPFAGEDFIAILSKLLLLDPPRLAELSPAIPPALDDLVARLLAKSPHDRPGSATAVAEELARIQEMEPSEQAPPSAAASTGITEREQRLVTIVLAWKRPDTVPPGSVRGEAPTTAGMDAPALLHDLAGSYDARLEGLLGGSYVAILSTREAATDQAERGTLLAFELVAMLPGHRVVVVTGRADVSAPLPAGEVIERAARFARAHDGGGVVVDNMTRDLLGQRFALAPRSDGVTEVRGLRDANASRLVLGKPAPFLGRERELSALGALFDDVVREKVVRVALIVAPPGMGKSRLVREFVAAISRSAAESQMVAAQGELVKIGAPFALIAQLVRSAAGIAIGEPVSTQHRKLRGRFGSGATGSDADRVVPMLADLVGAPPTDVPGREILPAADTRHAVEALRGGLREWIRAECATAPLVIVVEDAQWADHTSIDALHALLAEISSCPLLLILTSRPEAETALARAFPPPDTLHLRLDPIAQPAATRFVRQLLGERLGQDIIRRIVQRSEGNPFYLEELVRAASAGHAGDMPETVLAMVQTRVTSLEPEARLLLRAGSIFGERFWRDGAAAITTGSLPAAALDRWLHAMQEKEVIVAQDVSRFDGQPEYAFRHALVREASYGMLTEEDRQAGHVLAAEWLEAKGETDATVLAEHLAAGHQNDRAAGYFARAAQAAIWYGDLDRSIEHAERALSLATSRPIVDSATHVLIEGLGLSGRPLEAHRHVERALARTAPGSGAWLRYGGQLLFGVASYGPLFDVDEIILRLEKASAIDQPIESLTALALYRLGHRLLADRLVTKSLALESVGERSIAARPYLELAKVTYSEHDPERLLTLARLAVRLADATGSKIGRCRALMEEVFALMALGRLKHAVETSRELVELAETLGHTPNRSAHRTLALVLSRTDQADEVAFFVGGLMREVGNPPNLFVKGGLHVALARAHQRARGLGQAEREAIQAVECYAHLPPHHAEALSLLARARLSLGDVDAARTDAREAFEIAVSVSGTIDYVEAEVILTHAEACIAAGLTDDARVALVEGRRRLLARASKIQDTALRSSFMNVPENVRTMELAKAVGIG